MDLWGRRLLPTCRPIRLSQAGFVVLLRILATYEGGKLGIFRVFGTFHGLAAATYVFLFPEQVRRES
jgi:hypothetical protein